MPKGKARDTKDVILTVALKLFSERGYEGVGIRDIAKEIGIRESALYKHYSGKQAIFDSILKDIERRYHAYFSDFRSSESMSGIFKGEGGAKEDLFRISAAMFQFYLKNDYGSQLRRLLTTEQYRTSDAGRFFRELIVDNGLDDIARVFDDLKKNGECIDVDSRVMALQFYSPLYLLLSKYDNQPDNYDEALSFLEKHITVFNEIYLKGDRQ